MIVFFFFQAEDGIRDDLVTGVQTCALPICEPPLITLLNEERSYWLKSGCCMIAINMVGTPPSMVQRSLLITCKALSGSKAMRGCSVAPAPSAARIPNTQPPAWKKGMAVQRWSSQVMPQQRAKMAPLLRIARCDWTAPLGKPVVPEV